MFLFPFRPSTCKYTRIGCPWRGPFHELRGHEEICTHPKKTGNEILESLDKIDSEQTEKQKVFKDIFRLLSFEKVTFNGKLRNIFLSEKPSEHGSKMAQSQTNFISPKGRDTGKQKSHMYVNLQETEGPQV